MPEFEVSIAATSRAGCHVVQVSGDLGRDAAPVLRDKTVALLIGPGHAHLILDLARLTSCDPAGTGAIITTLKWVMLAGGHLSIAAMPAHILQDFQRRKLDRIFTFYDTVDQALTG
ncbi:STAS domain-containing protein [Nonomuraea sp. NPDC002799]